MKRLKKNLGAAFAGEFARKPHHFKNGKVTADDWDGFFLPNFRPEGFYQTVSPWRVTVVGGFFLLIFFGLFLRLFHLQVIFGAQNRELADSNRVQIRIIHAPRGVIYDRNGKVLAENNPGFRLDGKFISRDEALSLEAKGDEKFDRLEVDTIRSYPLGPVTAHVLGYVSESSQDELKQPEYSGYRIGDKVGRAGIEQAYELVLRGTDGAEIVEIDAKGRKLRILRRIDPIPGQNIYLSIDADLQKAAYDALQSGVQKSGSCCGAAVAADPKTGEILALISWPSFDSNAFTDPQKNSEVSAYFADPRSPLLNRVISGTYPPGSTFKITSALAGLSSGKIDADWTVEDTGVISLGPFQFANWYFTQYGKKEGMVDIVKALQRSNDIFFYKVGETIGEKKLGETALQLGIGRKLGIDLPGEASGLTPDDSWKKAHAGEDWYPGDTLHMAIGQGFLLATPLQILEQTAYVAADGGLMQPHLAVKITQPDGSLVKQFHYGLTGENLFKKSDLKLVEKGLSEVPKPGGTAWPFFNFSIPTSGKTGTAEFGDPKDRTHAWYTSFAPTNDPKITLTVLVEAAGEGSNVSAPIAKQIYTWYFNPDKTHIKSLDTAPVATASAKTLGE